MVVVVVYGFDVLLLVWGVVDCLLLYVVVGGGGVVVDI